MTLFLFLAAAMILLALALVIVPLLRSSPRTAAERECLTVLADGVRELDTERLNGTLDPAAYDVARRELERQALESDRATQARGSSNVRANWGAALATGIALPLFAAVLYVALGQPLTVLDATSPSRVAGAAHAPTDGAIETLSRRLEKNPDDGQGWVLLARSYFQAGRIAEAMNAYRKAAAIMPDTPDLLVEYANTVAIANHRSLAGEPRQLVERALKINPDNLNALAFAGLAALQADNRDEALRHWRHLQSLVPADSEDRSRIDALIAQAEGKPAQRPSAPAALAKTAAGEAGDAADARVAAAHGPVIRGTVTIAGALAAKVAPTDTLFVFARAINGPPMPLAAVRTRAGAWPVSFTLDDSSAMAQGIALSQFAHVNIVARVSRLGNATSQPGDIEGTIENVALGSSDVRVVMDRVVGR
ncbi:MAG: c-type cytochrome biogenesis protein CcmI [Burkholderiaceae bacterium]